MSVNFSMTYHRDLLNLVMSYGSGYSVPDMLDYSSVVHLVGNEEMVFLVCSSERRYSTSQALQQIPSY